MKAVIAELKRERDRHAKALGQIDKALAALGAGIIEETPATPKPKRKYTKRATKRIRANEMRTMIAKALAVHGPMRTPQMRQVLGLNGRGSGLINQLHHMEEQGLIRISGKPQAKEGYLIEPVGVVHDRETKVWVGNGVSEGRVKA